MIKQVIVHCIAVQLENVMTVVKRLRLKYFGIINTTEIIFIMKNDEHIKISSEPQMRIIYME